MTELNDSWATYDPRWTEPEFGRGGGRDNLGLEALSESILADLLPGINNQTRRARYYSFWAWVLRDFILDRDAVHTEDGWCEWLRRREAALILSYLAHGCSGGAAGTDQGTVVWGDGQAISYPLDWKSLLSVDGGSYELYYHGPLVEMNIVGRGPDSPHDDLTSGIGRALADAYAESVAQTEYVRHYLDASRLRKTDIEDFAQHGCLCQLPQHPDEAHKLIEAFFRFDTPDAYAVKRLVSLCYFLDIVAQSDGQPLGVEAFRTVLYFWSFGQHHPYQPAGNLVSAAQRWRIFQLRQYFVFAVESLWSLFLSRVEIEPLAADEYTAWLADSLNLKGLAETFNLDLRDTDPRVLTVETLYRCVRDAPAGEAVGLGPAALRTDLNEQFLAERMGQERSKSDAHVRAGYALLSLALMYWRCQPWQREPGWLYVSDRYAAGRIPMASHLRHVDQAIREGWTLARWLSWLHHRYIWLQHRRIALEKLVARRETALFELLDDTPPDLQGDRTPRMRATGSDSPKTNAPRFPSALGILADLEIVRRLANGGYQLSSDGVALLDRFRAYSVPEIVEPRIDETPDRDQATTGR